MKKFRKITILVLVNTLITFLLLELIGVCVYYLRHDALFYLRTVPVGEGESLDRTREPDFNGKQVLHPFLGYINRPSLSISQIADEDRLSRLLFGAETIPSWTKLRANNYGFFSPFNYPYQRATPQEFIVGVFGGSVAQWFSLQGAARLREHLQQLPSLKNREIIVLNFAQGGFKQPQQLQALNYFYVLGQEFDFIVNIDGLNEIVLSHINHMRNVSTAMPSTHHIVPILNLLATADKNLKIIDDVYSLRESERKMRRLERWRSATKSAGLHLIVNALYTKSRNNYIATVQKSESLSHPKDRTNLVHLSTLPSDYDRSTSIKDALDLWRNASMMMQDICNAKDIPYLEIVQPNQYFSLKVFTQEERDIAINEKSPYLEAIKKGFPHIISHFHRMHQMQINVKSAVSIFDEVNDPVYSDDCCHYNQIGNEILADYVAESMLALIATHHDKQATEVDFSMADDRDSATR